MDEGRSRRKSRSVDNEKVLGTGREAQEVVSSACTALRSGNNAAWAVGAQSTCAPARLPGPHPALLVFQPHCGHALTHVPKGSSCGQMPHQVAHGLREPEPPPDPLIPWPCERRWEEVRKCQGLDISHRDTKASPSHRTDSGGSPDSLTGQDQALHALRLTVSVT